MKEIIEFLDEVMEHNEVPIRLRHAALGLKLSIISAQVETPSVGNKKDKEEKCCHPRDQRKYIGMNMLKCKICGKEFS